MQNANNRWIKTDFTESVLQLFEQLIKTLDHFKKTTNQFKKTTNQFINIKIIA